MRAVYHIRAADGIIAEAIDSAYLSLLDACKGFNQIANFKRTSEMLAILAHNGSFLLKCLTFGSYNGPEVFAFVIDRVFAPGRGRKQRLCSEWLIYADDITIRTGRVVDGVLYTESEWND